MFSGIDGIKLLTRPTPSLCLEISSDSKHASGDFPWWVPEDNSMKLILAHSIEPQ